MNSRCLICFKNSSRDVICDICIKDPYKIELFRKLLVKRKEFPRLKETYTNSYPEINNLNTANFWDKKFEKPDFIRNQDGMTKDRIKIASKFIKVRSGKVLDVAAGQGFLEEILSKNKNFKLYAIDISRKSIDGLINRFTGNFTIQSVYKLNFPNDFFDAIFCLEIFEHIPTSKILSVLNALNKILKKKGELVVSVPINEGLEEMYDNPNGHVRVYSKEVIKAELILSGFNILEIKEFYAFEKMYSFKKIVSKLFRNRWQPNNILIKVQKP